MLLAVAAPRGLLLATTRIWYSLHRRHTAPPPTTTAAAPAPTLTRGMAPPGVRGAWRLHPLPCGLRPAAVTGRGTKPVSGLPRTAVVVATENVYADHAGLGARHDGDTVTVSVTTGTCRP